jgi:hypothetical protein
MGLRVGRGYRETAETCQINQIQTMFRGNSGRFDMVEGWKAEMRG